MVASGLTSAVTSFACTHVRTNVDVVMIKADIDIAETLSVAKLVRFIQDTPHIAAILHGALIDVNKPKLIVDNSTLSSKNVFSLVTGGARGIGENISRELAKAGHNVIVTARPGGNLGESFVSDLRTSYGVDARFLPLDLSDHDSIAQLARSLKDLGFVLDVVVHNAAVGTKTAAYQTNEHHDLNDVLIHVNSVGPVVLQQELMSSGCLRQDSEGGCTVLAISSVGALRPFAEMQPIDLASKAMMSTWAKELNKSHRGLNVIVLAPGATDTDMLQQSVLNALKESGKLSTFISLLTKRMLINPEDLGILAAFICQNDMAHLLHGSMISACCGLHLDFNGLPNVE